MGNRAVIGFKGMGVGIYLHWNGGLASVEAFLRCADDLGVRPDEYGVARLAQIIGNFFGGTYSVGVGKLEDLDCDNWDNGTYMVEDWLIVDRLHMNHEEEIDLEKTKAIYEECMEVSGPIFRRDSNRNEHKKAGGAWKVFIYDGRERVAYFKEGSTPYQVVPEAGFRNYDKRKMEYVQAYQGDMVEPEVLEKYPDLLD